MERGCYLLVSDPLGRMPNSSLYWHIDSFASRARAEAAKGPLGTIVEAVGQVWLFTIGAAESWRPAGGDHIATHGPFAVDIALDYTAAYAEAILLPGASSAVHRHAGPELIHVLAGEECMETPSGAQRGLPGGKAVYVPTNIPHKLTVTGTIERRALALVLHDSREPWVNRANDHGWSPKGLCGQT